MSNSPFRPAEAVITGAAVNLEGAGISEDVFIATAPLCACRLCGAVYQTKFHRQLHKQREEGNEDPALLAKVLDLGNEWREGHFKYNHTQDEVEALNLLGWAFMPSAAHKLAPYGIIALGNMHKDIVDAMYEAPRAPDLEMLNDTAR